MPPGGRWSPILFALAVPAAAFGGAPAALAQEPGGQTGTGEIQLDTITVTAPSGMASVYDSPTSTTVVDRTEIETQIQPGRPSEVLDILPGVATTTNGGDPGTSVNIRGLQDFGRVKVTIDGAPQNFQKSGHGANGVFYIDPEMIKQVEVSRGAGSATDGNGSIGGGVEFRTIDAGDVLDPGDKVGGRLKQRYTSNGDGMMGHAEAAGRIGDAFDVIAAGTMSKIGSYRDGDGNLVPSSWDNLESGLIKARIRPDAGHELTLSALHYHDFFDDGVATVRATTVDADTYTARYTFDDPDSNLIDLAARAYYTTTDQNQLERIDRHDGIADPRLADRQRNFFVGTVGGDIQNISRFDTGVVGHTMKYGANISQDNVVTSEPNGATPSGQRLLYGSFVEDKLHYGWFDLIGALRHDAFQTGKQSDSHLSPKVTLAVTPIEPVTFFLTYAEAFRAPAVTESLIAGVHPAGPQFVFIPNPGLKPEIAHEIDAGVNLRFNDVVQSGDKFRAKVTAYRNIVDDYISMEFIDSPKYPDGAYQYQNIARAKLWGVELEAMYDAGKVFAGVAATHGNGINMITGKRLSTIPADRIIGTIGFRPIGGTDKLMLGARISAYGDTKIPKSELGQMELPNYYPYQVVDLFASAKLTEDVSLILNLDNLLDEQYTQFWNTWPSRGRSGKATLIAKF